MAPPELDAPLGAALVGLSVPAPPFGFHILQSTFIAKPVARPPSLLPKRASEEPSSLQVSKLTFAPKSLH